MAEAPNPKSNPLAGWIRRYPIQILTLGVIVGFVVAYGATRHQKPFPDWDKPPVQSGAPTRQPEPTAPPQASSVPTGQPQESPEERSRRLMYDPDDADVDPRYRLPIKLSTDELHQRILDMECLVDLAGAHNQLINDYFNLKSIITAPQVREVLFWRIKNRAGFKQPHLPTRWGEFSEAAPPLTIVDRFRVIYVSNRVERIRTRIIAGTYTAGDFKFIAYATDHYNSNIPSVADWVAKGKLIHGWLVDDGVLTADSVVSTSLDNVASAQDLIQTIRRRHTDAPAPKDVPSPIARVQPNDNSQPAPSGELLERARRQAIQPLTDDQRRQLFSSLDRLGRSLTRDLRFLPEPAPKRDPAQGEMRRQLEENIQRQEREKYVPALTQARINHVTRRAMFRQIGPDLESYAGNLDKSARDKALAAYRGAMAAKVAHSTQTEEKAIHVLRELGGRRVDDSTPFTVGELEDIHATEKWLDESLAKYKEHGEQLDQLIKLLRNIEDPDIHRLTACYIVDRNSDGLPPPDWAVWAVDPFSKRPTTAFPVNRDTAYKTCRGDKELPHFYLNSSTGSDD